MKPYFEDESVTIYHGDCRVILPQLDVGDAVLVTDPPYGMGYVSNSSKVAPTAAIAGDSDTRIRDEILAIWGDRPALVFGTWRAPRPPGCVQLLVWDKGESPGMGDLSIPWGPAHEEIYVLGRGFAGKRKANVLRWRGLAAGDADRPNHPTPKPVPLMRDLIAYCPPGALIIDPFMGSGTTLRAAKDLGRRAIGIEMHNEIGEDGVDRRYCAMAVERLRQGLLL